jgi:hypothetical protein
LAPTGLGQEAADALATVGICMDELEAHSFPGWYFAPMPVGKANACGVQEIVAALAEGEAFQFVAPVFPDSSIVTQELLVTFNDEPSRDEAQQILDQLQAGVITDALGANPATYLVRNPARSGFVVLEAVSRLREHPGVRSADPNWISTGSAG